MAKGYTKISNELFDFLCSSNIEYSELKVLLFLIRYTLGFHRETTRASISYISRGTSLSENTVRKALRNLIKKGYVEVEYEHRGKSAQILKLILQKVEGQGVQKLKGDYLNNCGVNTTKNCTQDIIEDSKDKKEKKRKASPSLFPNFSIDDYSGAEAKAWKDVLSEDDFQKWLGGYIWD